jgi:hypothetical protein
VPADEPAAAARLRAALMDYLARLGPQREANRVHDAELRQQLEDLGYVDGE